jgi:hypothetical protein
MSDEIPEKPGLARFEEGGRLQADLDRALTDKMLARADVGGAVARDLEAGTSLMLPTLSDIDRKLTEAEQPVASSQTDIEKLLSIESVGDIAVEGMRLNELLDHGSISIQERATVKKGLLFLRRKMYPEAAEWWLLNRPKDVLSNPRFYCLTSLLLAFTYQLSGQTALAQAAVQEAVQARKLI